MSQLKDMYKTIQTDIFPEDLSLRLGGEELRFKKRVWHLDGETLGLRYGENPDQPAALYEFVGGELNLGGIIWRGPIRSTSTRVSTP